MGQPERALEGGAPVTTATMEYLREDMAAGALTPWQIDLFVDQALRMATITRPTNPDQALEYATFATDMLRAKVAAERDQAAA